MSLLGNISLNIAMIIYIIQYLPQLYHNKTPAHLKKMSLMFHYIFFMAYLADLIYAVGMHMPWQYIFVSIVGLTALLIQQQQLTKIYSTVLLHTLLIILVVLFIAAISINTIKQTPQFYINLEVISYIGFLTFRIPQLYRNWRLKTGTALNTSYLLLSLLCTICDNFSSWCLNWPWPNKVGAMFLLIIISLLLLQMLYYRKKENVPLFKSSTSKMTITSF